MLLNQRKFALRPSIKAPGSSFQQFITFVEPERILQDIKFTQTYKCSSIF
jgi:hypothetical protein